MLEVGSILVENLPFSAAKKKRIGNDLRLAIAIHDTGKAATGFQKSLAKGAEPWKCRHEILSACFGSSLGFKEEVIFAVITHHKTLPLSSIYGCLPDEQIPYGPDHVYPVWDQMAQEWHENIESFDQEWSKICEYINRKDLSADSKKLDLLSTIMGKNRLGTDKQTGSVSYKQRYYASLLRGLLISSDHIASSHSSTPTRVPQLTRYNATNVLKQQLVLHGFQKRASKKIGNVILRAPTGSGKTLAALLWSSKNQRNNGRLFYALPTTASINAMYRRLRDYFNDDKRILVGLLHSRVASSIYSMLEEEGDSSSKINQGIARSLSSLAREMYFPIRVCTPHQILRYSLQGKGWELMLSEFPNSCFVFDEIHAYNPKLTGLTIATAKFLIEKNATCMFLSATLPKFIRKLIEHEIPSISFLQPSHRNNKDRQILNQKRHIRPVIVDDTILSPTNIDLILKEADNAKSTLVVCNHVPTAQQVYRELKDKIKNTVLLHSQFCRRDRNTIENKLISEPLPKIFVSTQVVEVSLDIDFEQGFLEPAPIDALVQRLGRINRYGKRAPAKVRIFEEQHHSFNIYDKVLTDKSLKVLSTLNNPLGEEDLSQAADYVYGKGYSYENQIEYDEGLNYFRLKEFKKYLKAGTYQYWIDEVIDETEGSEDLLPESLVNEYNMYNSQGLKIDANDLLVPVGRWRLNYLTIEDRIDKSQDPWIIKNAPYSAEVGLEI